jgi:hypothetical protein
MGNPQPIVSSQSLLIATKEASLFFAAGLNDAETADAHLPDPLKQNNISCKGLFVDDRRKTSY